MMWKLVRGTRSAYLRPWRKGPARGPICNRGRVPDPDAELGGALARIVRLLRRALGW